MRLSEQVGNDAQLYINFVRILPFHLPLFLCNASYITQLSPRPACQPVL